MQDLRNLGHLGRPLVSGLWMLLKATFSQTMLLHKISNQILTAYEGELTCVEAMIPNMGNIKPGSRAVIDKGNASVIQKMATTKRT